MVVIYVSSNALLRGETRLTIIPNYKKVQSFRSLLRARKFFARVVVSFNFLHFYHTSRAPPGFF